MSYSQYIYSLTRSGNFFVLTFTVATNHPFVLPSLVYLNRDETHVQIDSRLGQTNLVTFTDGQGSITVDYTKCSTIVSISAANFISQVLAL